MSGGPYCLSIPTILAIFVCSLSGVAWPQGFPGGHRDALGPHFEPAPGTRQTLGHPSYTTLDSVRHWNRVAIDASGLDHTPVAPGEARVFGEQFGPARASRAMAIVHIAVFEAVNAIAGGYRSYTGTLRAPKGSSMTAAIAQAAHDTLVALFPSQAVTFDTLLAEDLKSIPNGRGKKDGIDLGQRTARAILDLRDNDGSEHPEPRIDVDFFTDLEPGKWRQDPISENPLALGARLGGGQAFCHEGGQPVSSFNAAGAG